MVGIFLGGGLLASFASFIYPVLRYLVPPAVVDLGGDEVVAAKVTDLKPNSGKTGDPDRGVVPAAGGA